MYIYEKNNVPIKVWMKKEEYLSDKLLVEQMENLTLLPSIQHHVALMPDGHLGYGVPIGCVFGTKDIIVPNAVGVDISCGVLAMKTSITELSMEQIKKLFGGSKEHKGGIRSKIPVGFSHHSKKQKWEGFDEAPDIFIINEELESAKKQLGTLGGGNHFIEIQKGSDGFIWLMIHSGSRNIGFKIANYYNKVAKKLNETHHSNAPKNLNFLPYNSNEGVEYLQAMNFAMKFAGASREYMMCNIMDEFVDLFKEEILFTEPIHINHNYAAIENHYGKNVWIHRKGATLARDNQGLIPGSQGTCSYVVEGKSNPESFMSCSHGAGRVLSRKKAKEQLTVEEQSKKLNDMNIVHSIRNESDLDEAPDAYKDINQVMKNQEDLIKILVELKPLGVIKG